MRTRATTMIVTALLIGLIPAVALAQLTPYSQDFELLIQPDPAALAGDGWTIFGNAFAPDGTSFLYGYGPFPAPNHALAFCQIAVLEGGAEQGVQQLSVFNDYENADHGIGNFIESNVFQEQIVGPENLGETWVFSFQAKRGNIEGLSTAKAFIKIIQNGPPYDQFNIVTEDMTAIPDTWGGYSVSLEIDAGMVGHFFQFGFLSVATAFQGSGIFYDNLDFAILDPTDVPSDQLKIGAALRQNYPNPFNPSTRIKFELDRPGNVELTVFDLAGRRVATLHRGYLDVGEHSMIWNGRTDGGAVVASGRYSYVLNTPDGQASRNMILLK